jgi:alkylation response protein AidB-like acyl-CoA dehydrogenase
VTVPRTSGAGAIEAALAASEAFSARVSAELDEAAAFPAEQCALLDEWGLPRAYVPAAMDGPASPDKDPAGLFGSLRAVARRDLTVAWAHGATFDGAAPVWLAGTLQQCRELARLVREGVRVGSSMFELEDDFFRGVPTAARTPSGWRFEGTARWLRNAGRARLLCLPARTEPGGAAAAESLFLVDTDRLAPGTWEWLASEPTHGLRGAGVGAIRFSSAEIPDGSLVGGVGEAGTITASARRLFGSTSRAALSLGAGEHALQLVLDFAAVRAMHGTTLLRLPLARRTLGAAAASLALAEAASRAFPALAGLWVPALVQDVIDELAEVLGVRSFLTGQHAHGAFQKLDRDHRTLLLTGPPAAPEDARRLLTVLAGQAAAVDEAVRCRASELLQPGYRAPDEPYERLLARWETGIGASV